MNWCRGLIVSIALYFPCCAAATDTCGVKYNAFLEGWSFYEAWPLTGNDQESSSSVWTEVLTDSRPPVFHRANSSIKFGALHNEGSVSRNKGLIAMARTTVTVECKTVAVLACSADERLLVFLNRELVGDFNGAGSAKLDDFKTTITLEKGPNELSLISTNSGGEWGAFVRFLPTKINHEYILNYHLKPFPPGIADVPSATMTFQDSRGSTITEYEVSAWRDQHNSNIAVYKCYFYSEPAPVTVGINVAVPYMQDNFVNRLPFTQQFASIGRPGNMTVWGKVVDISTGAPVPHATVTIVGSNELTSVSCVDGFFRYETVDPAYSMIEVRANGYWPDTFAYDVNYLDDKILKLKPIAESRDRKNFPFAR